MVAGLSGVETGAAQLPLILPGAWLRRLEGGRLPTRYARCIEVMARGSPISGFAVENEHLPRQRSRAGGFLIRGVGLDHSDTSP